MALLHARASKSAAIGGSLMRSKREAITMPSKSRATTPNPAKSVSMKVAPSKFILYRLKVGVATIGLSGIPCLVVLGRLAPSDTLAAVP